MGQQLWREAWVGEFNVAIQNLKASPEAMQTDEFRERGSVYRRAKSKEPWEVRKGGKKDKEGTTDCEP